MKNMRRQANIDLSPMLQRGVRACVVLVLAMLTQGFGFGTMFWSKQPMNYASYRNTVMKDLPTMGYWRLGDASGTTAVDSSLVGNTGTYNGTCTLKQTGAIQNNTNFATSFNGSNCYVSTPNGYAQTSISIEAWFKTSAATLGGIATLSNTSIGSVSPTLAVNANGTVAFYAYGSPSYTTIASPGAYNNGAWHHVVATVGPAGMILYVDGVAVATSNLVTTHWTAGTQYWTIGRGYSTTNYFNGTLDEVALYTTQLTAAQVQSHYQAGIKKGLTVNRHCLDIRNNGNSTGNGIYTIYPNGGSTALSVYCNMSDQGGGWTLIGRGRYDWLWNEAGLNTTLVHQNVGTTSAFAPAYYSSATVNQILEYKPVNQLTDGILIRRAADTTGTSWQFYKWFLTSQASWSWLFTNSYATSKVYINGTQYGAGNTIDYSYTGNDGSRIFTWNWVGHCSVYGFSYGYSISAGANNATSYLWQCAGEWHSIPYTEVYVRQNNDVGNAAVREWVAVAQTTTYAAAISTCAGRGKKLCTRDQYCPYGSAGWELPWGGSRGASDQWAPVLEPANDWVQVGVLSWPTCQLHSEVAGQAYGLPSWGTSATAYAFRTYIMCCE